jgi:hypothetical protein
LPERILISLVQRIGSRALFCGRGERCAANSVSRNNWYEMADGSMVSRTSAASRGSRSRTPRSIATSNTPLLMVGAEQAANRPSSSTSCSQQPIARGRGRSRHPSSGRGGGLLKAAAAEQQTKRRKQHGHGVVVCILCSKTNKERVLKAFQHSKSEGIVVYIRLNMLSRDWLIPQFSNSVRGLVHRVESRAIVGYRVSCFRFQLLEVASIVCSHLTICKVVSPARSRVHCIRV